MMRWRENRQSEDGDPEKGYRIQVGGKDLKQVGRKTGDVGVGDGWEWGRNKSRGLRRYSTAGGCRRDEEDLERKRRGDEREPEDSANMTHRA
jgi:hypothetical protein